MLSFMTKRLAMMK